MGDCITDSGHCRPPSFVALRECLRLQAGAPTLSRFSRILGIDPLSPPAALAYRGALAELAVVRALGSLGSDWTVLHSLGFVDADASVEHLVIGAPGVFCLSVRNHSGQRVWVGERTFMVDDVLLDHIQVSEAACAFVAERISGPAGPQTQVTPCIVIDSPAELVIYRRARVVEVLSSRTLIPWLRGLPRLLPPDAVSRLSDTARANGNLPQRPGPTDTPARLHEFGRLRQSVTRSRFRRLTWVGLGVVVSYGLLLVRIDLITLTGVSLAGN